MTFWYAAIGRQAMFGVRSHIDEQGKDSPEHWPCERFGARLGCLWWRRQFCTCCEWRRCPRSWWYAYTVSHSYADTNTHAHTDTNSDRRHWAGHSSRDA